jgi:flagellar hook-associated protein FlgK
MNSVTNISRSGMNAAQARLQTSAHNIANMNTEGFHRQEVVQQTSAAGGVSTSVTRQTEEGASLAQDVVQQLAAKNAFLANLAVFKRSNEALGNLLNSKA